MEYRDLLDKAYIIQFVRDYFHVVRRATHLFGLLGLFRDVLAMVRTNMAVVESLAAIEKAGGKDARRLAELTRVFYGWLLILLGASALFTSAVIDLSMDYPGSDVRRVLIGIACALVVIANVNRLIQIVRKRWSGRH